MIAQLVIVFYFIVCVGIIIFNCFTEIISRYRSCVLKRREQRYCEEYRQLFSENITENKKQEKRLVKELHSASRLLTFSEALSKVENSMPEQFQQGIASVSRLMEELIPVYKRKPDMEKACLAYVFAIFHMTKFQAKEIVFPFLFDLLGNKSLYCRENALRALYSSEDIQAVMQALTFLDANEQLLPHKKILADGLLSFDKKEELIPLLWKKLSEFHPRMQVSLLDIFDMHRQTGRNEMLSMLETSQDMEIQIACVRYFGRYQDERSVSFLLHHAEEERKGSGNCRMPVFLLLLCIPDRRHWKILKKRLPVNWYVRYNAAKSLAVLNTDRDALADILQGNDRYAKEMLEYQLDEVKVQRGAGL